MPETTAIRLVLMISTTDAQGGRAEPLARMVRSVEAFASRRPDLRLRLMLLVQRSDGSVSPVENMPSFVETGHTSDRLSLSAARNRQIDAARTLGLFGPDAVVLFPDDDCWYPDGVLDGIVSAFAVRPDLDLWFCRYSSQPFPFAAGAERLATAADTTRRASSNTFAFRGHLLADDLAFDETLGVGTPNAGGEDTAFALAAFARSRLALFLDSACIGHRDADPSFIAKYYRGALIALARNASVAGVPAEFARKLMVGAYLVMRGRLPARRYLDDAAAGLGAFRAARRGAP